MGCVCSRDLLDTTFEVDLPPEDARRFLIERNNWLQIIPGCSDGSVADAEPAAGPGAWTLTINAYTYTFMNTELVSATDTLPLGLSYDVHVRGVASGLPIDFSFHVDYNFSASNSGVGTQLRRLSTRFSTRGISRVIGRTIKAATQKGMAKENAAMAILMASKEKLYL